MTLTPRRRIKPFASASFRHCWTISRRMKYAGREIGQNVERELWHDVEVEACHSGAHLGELLLPSGRK